MKRQFVSSLQEGDVVHDYFVATRKDLRDMQSGGKFLGLVFKDKTGEIGGVMWNNAVSVANLFELGDVVTVRGTVNNYQNRLQVRVDQVLPLRNEEYDPADLVDVPENTEEVAAKFCAVMDTIQGRHLHTLIQMFIHDEAFMERFKRASAGKKWHHSHRGGLIQHCYEMTRIAETMCQLYDNLDRDLLMAGIFVHDIGKIDEMTHDLFVDYTTAGRLVGHLQLGFDRVSKKIDAIEDFPESTKLQLYHLILSHHGEYQFGSPVLPKTVEAVVLYLIDNLDAQANAYSRVVDETLAKGQAWSEFISMIDRQIWTKRD